MSRIAPSALVAVLLAIVLAGCSSLRSDGPPSNPPPDLIKVPDADPRLEPIRDGGPNKPYEALGKLYTPIRSDLPFNERGLASWYGRKFQGRRTASGEPYDMYAMTAAHRTMPIPSYARVRNPANGREIVVRINDRGPFHSDRVIDLSYTAALKLGVLSGVAPVELTRITFDDIRTGAWRKPGSTDGGVDLSTLDGGGAIVGASTGGRVAPASAAPPAQAAGPGGPPVIAAAMVPSGLVAIDGVPAPSGSGDSADAAPASRADVSAPAAAAPLSNAAPASAATGVTAARPAAAGPGFWVQLGAFKQQSGAEAFHRKVAADLSWLGPLLSVASDGSLFRLQAGPFADRGAAQGVSQRIRDSLRLVPVIVDKR